MNILSIQSSVTYGHVGNSSAMFPLQRLGAEVWPIDTVRFSNHPGYGGFTGEVFSPESVRALVDGIAARGVLARCNAVLSGYVGQASTGDVVLYAVGQMRAQNAEALYCCDPVIGDTATGVYVRAGIDTFFREAAMPQADLLTPNQFELGQLTGLPTDTLADARRAAISLRGKMRAAGPRVVLVTGLDGRATLDLLVASDAGTHVLRTARLPAAFNGAGDMIAALLLFHVCAGRSPVAAAELAAASVGGVLRATLQAGAKELRLVQAQAEFVAPSLRVTAEPC